MADYYPLLSRAIVNLGDAAGPDMRRAIYDKARTTLRAQLEAIDPPLPQDHIERERAQLEAVIARLEIEARARSRPQSQPPLRYTQPAAAGAGDRAADDDYADHDDHQDHEHGGHEHAARDAHEHHGEHEDLAQREPAGTAAAAYPHDHAAADESAASRHAQVAPPSRPAPRVPAINWRIAGIGAAAVVVIAGLAGLAYTYRDQVDPARREQAEQAAANPAAPAQATPEAKIGERLGGQAATPAVATASDNSQQIPVAQRATLFIEVPGATDQVPRTVAGRVVWNFENLPGKPGQPLDPALVGTVQVPDAGITLKLQMTRNREASLPASYLIGLVFTTKDSTAKEIAPVLMKSDESDRGVPLIGIQQPLGPNLFVMALSSADNDIARNFDLLTKRGWIEVQFRLADQRRAALVFEKGLAGDRALLAAIDAWK